MTGQVASPAQSSLRIHKHNGKKPWPTHTWFSEPVGKASPRHIISTRFGEATNITLADLHRERAQAAADRVNDLVRHRIADAIGLDVRDENAIRRALKGYGVVLSAVPYFYNLALTRAAIETGVSFRDLGGNTEIVRQQHALDRDAHRAGDTLFEPQLRCIVRAHAKGKKNGQPTEAVVEVIDYYDKTTGFTAMQRMTGWHISIVAAMMAKQKIPLGAMPLELAVPGRAFVREAKRRGFKITEHSGPVGIVEEAYALMS